MEENGGRQAGGLSQVAVRRCLAICLYPLNCGNADAETARETAEMIVRGQTVIEDTRLAVECIGLALSVYPDLLEGFGLAVERSAVEGYLREVAARLAAVEPNRRR